LQFQRGAAQFQRIIESLLDLDVEPAIDASVDELQREIKHDEQWQYGEPNEHADHACLELRPRHILPVIPRETSEIADQQRQQEHAARNVDRENEVLQPIEIVRFLDRLCQQEQSGEREADA
jgi:hypothetical protein